MNVREMLLQGLSYNEIRARTGLSKPTICYHAKKLGMVKRQVARVFPWEEINNKWLEGETRTALKAEYKIYQDAWDAARWRGDIGARAVRIPHNRGSLKKLLIASGVPEECSVCSLPPEWHGKPLRLQLDHIDGNTFNDEMWNLRLICPNCHTQTPTFTGRNTKKQRAKRV